MCVREQGVSMSVRVGKVCCLCALAQCVCLCMGARCVHQCAWARGRRKQEVTVTSNGMFYLNLSEFLTSKMEMISGDERISQTQPYDQRWLLCSTTVVKTVLIY